MNSNCLLKEITWKYDLLEVKEDDNWDDKSCQRDSVASLVDEIYLGPQLENEAKYECYLNHNRKLSELLLVLLLEFTR